MCECCVRCIGLPTLTKKGACNKRVGGKEKEKEIRTISSNVYEQKEKKLPSFFSFTAVFHYIRKHAHQIRCPKWPAAGRFHWLPTLTLYSVVIYTNSFKNIQLTPLRKTQLWHFYYCFMIYIYISHPVSPLNSVED